MEEKTKPPTEEPIVHDKEEGQEELPDFSTYTREQLVETVEKLSRTDKFKRIDIVLAQIEPRFKAFEDDIRHQAFLKYIEEGGEEESFDFRHDALFNRFDASVRLIKDKRSAFYREKEAAKKKNLEKKQERLEQLRTLVDSEQATLQIKPVKEIQKAWKATGPVPIQHNKTLWANYNALLDRFYHNRNILLELQDLDRKRNYTAKVELCDKAEALSKLENIKDAVFQLNELHKEYKRIGAVPGEMQEALWQRFKAASDRIHRKRNELADHLKGDIKENLVQKEALIQELEPYTTFDSEKIKDWHAKTNGILNLQKRWESLGPVPSKKRKEVNKDFWSSFKKFFSNKHEFFKKVELIRVENLRKKEKLVQQAVGLKKSKDWENTAEVLRQLQHEWKTMGEVPEKHSNEVYARFKAACDSFFDNRRSYLDQPEEEYAENQRHKEAVLNKILERAAQGETSEEELTGFIKEYAKFGFVPKDTVKALEVRLKEAVVTYSKSMGMNKQNTESLVLKAELLATYGKEGVGKKHQKREAIIKRQINELEENITLWNNNLSFFANSKAADKLKGEFDIKIAEAAEKIKKLKNELSVLKLVVGSA